MPAQKRKRQVKREDEEEEDVEEVQQPIRRITRRRVTRRRSNADNVVEDEVEEPAKKKRKSKSKDEDFVPEDEDEDEEMTDMVDEPSDTSDYEETTSKKRNQKKATKKKTTTAKRSAKEKSPVKKEVEQSTSEDNGTSISNEEKVKFDPRVYMYSPGSKVAVQDEKRHKYFVDKLLSHSLREPENDGEDPIDQNSEEEAETPKKKSKATKKKKTPAKNASGGTRYTPMEKQIVQLKKEYPGVVLFVEIGYRFKLFGDDAVNASKVLGIIAYSSGNFMCASIPIQRLSFHLRRMINAGYKCGVVRQQETAAIKATTANKSAPFTRELENMYSASTLIGEDVGDIDENPCSHLLVLNERLNTNETVEISILAVDVSTGDIVYDGPFTDTSMRRELETRLCKIQPVEFLIPDTVSKETERLIREATYRHQQSAPRVEKLPGDKLSPEERKKKIIESLSERNSEKEDESEDEEDMESSEDQKDNEEQLKILNDIHEDLYYCIFHLMRFLKEFRLDSLLKIAASHFKSLETWGRMNLNSITMKNLEILQNSFDGSQRGSLYSILDRTRTKFGARLLKKWVAHPLANLMEIQDRLGAIEEIHEGKANCLNTVLDILKGLPDLEKTLMRIHYQKTSPKEFLKALLGFEKIFEGMPKEDEWKSQLKHEGLLYRTFAKIPDLSEFVHSFTDSFSHKAAEEGVKSALFIKQSKSGKFPEIAEYYALVQKAKEKIDEELEKGKKKLDKQNLKLKTYKNFKYVIEAPIAASKNAPKDWIKLGQTKAVVRYHTPLIMEQVKVIDLNEDRLEIESQKAWKELLRQFSAEYSSLKKLTDQFAILDCLNSLAEVSKMAGYTKAEYVPDDEDRVLEIKAGRHPILETIMLDSEFVPNNVNMTYEKQRVYVLTGPNMAGKSVFMKTMSLIVLMAQIGCFVPAEYCRMSLFDSIFTRMGASDNISRGQSTFFVELSEASEILHNATSKSLVLLDEIGRGTSTYDGYAIAHAILTKLIESVKCFTLFVTHYQLISHLSRVFDCVSNFHMSFSTSEDRSEFGEKNIKFLYKLVPGVAEKSYGINVARLAGIDSTIVLNAEQISRDSEQRTLHRVTQKNFETLLSLLLSTDASAVEPNREQVQKCQQIILQLSPLFS